MQIFLEYDLTLAEINPLVRLEDGRFVVLDGHVDMEAEARDKHKALLDELGIRPRTRRARRDRPRTSRSRARRSTRPTTAASRATWSSSTATSAS